MRHLFLFLKTNTGWEGWGVRHLFLFLKTKSSQNVTALFIIIIAPSCKVCPGVHSCPSVHKLTLLLLISYASTVKNLFHICRSSR